jgi:hypothetical protein
LRFSSTNRRRSASRGGPGYGRGSLRTRSPARQPLNRDELGAALPQLALPRPIAAQRRPVQLVADRIRNGDRTVCRPLIRRIHPEADAALLDRTDPPILVDAKPLLQTRPAHKPGRLGVQDRRLLRRRRADRDPTAQRPYKATPAIRVVFPLRSGRIDHNSRTPANRSPTIRLLETSSSHSSPLSNTRFRT